MVTPDQYQEHVRRRGFDADEIRLAYDQAYSALRKVGRLLRTTHAGMYMWSSDHKTAVSGLCVIVRTLRSGVPYYPKPTDDPNS